MSKFEKINRTFTLTFGDCAENHVGMQKIGDIHKKGFSPQKLTEWKEKFEELGAYCELFNLGELVDISKHCDKYCGKYCDKQCNTEDAVVLIVQEGINFVLGNEAKSFFEEQDALEKDTKAFMYGRVVNKKARYNLCFSEESQEPDYENKKGRIVSYNEVPILKKFRRKIPKILGPEVKHLVVEGNYYYDISKCGIGFHGDAERKKVIGVRLGADLPFHYQWYFNGKRIEERIEFLLKHGDIYFMSEKATGNDWKKRNIPTLRHAAGCKKFLE